MKQPGQTPEATRTGLVLMCVGGGMLCMALGVLCLLA